MEVRHLPPNEKAKPVRPVVPARVFDLLVLARPVEAHGLRELDVAAQVFVAAGGEQSAGKIALDEAQAFDLGGAVGPERARLSFDLAQADRGRYKVCSAAV